MADGNQQKLKGIVDSFLNHPLDAMLAGNYYPEGMLDYSTDATRLSNFLLVTNAACDMFRAELLISATNMQGESSKDAARSAARGIVAWADDIRKLMASLNAISDGDAGNLQELRQNRTFADVAQKMQAFAGSMDCPPEMRRRCFCLIQGLNAVQKNYDEAFGITREVADTAMPVQAGLKALQAAHNDRAESTLQDRAKEFAGAEFPNEETARRCYPETVFDQIKKRPPDIQHPDDLLSYMIFFQELKAFSEGLKERKKDIANSIGNALKPVLDLLETVAYLNDGGSMHGIAPLNKNAFSNAARAFQQIAHGLCQEGTTRSFELASDLESYAQGLVEIQATYNRTVGAAMKADILLN